MQMVREFLIHERFSDVFGTSDVAHWEEECRILRGRADFVVIHVDGSVTVVEAKGPGGMRNTLGGIGQLLSYMIQIGMSAGLTGRVRGVLVAPVSIGTEESRIIDEACERAGVRFVPSLMISDLNRNADRIYGGHNGS